MWRCVLSQRSATTHHALSQAPRYVPTPPAAFHFRGCLPACPQLTAQRRHDPFIHDAIHPSRLLKSPGPQSPQPVPLLPGLFISLVFPRFRLRAGQLGNGTGRGCDGLCPSGDRVHIGLSSTALPSRLLFPSFLDLSLGARLSNSPTGHPSAARRCLCFHSRHTVAPTELTTDRVPGPTRSTVANPERRWVGLGPFYLV
jgi:hypothetical protein